MIEKDEISDVEPDPPLFVVLPELPPPPQLIKLTPAKTAIVVRIYLQYPFFSKSIRRANTIFALFNLKTRVVILGEEAYKPKAALKVPSVSIVCLIIENRYKRI